MLIFLARHEGIGRRAHGADDYQKARNLKMLQTRTLGAATMAALLLSTTAVLANDIVNSAVVE